MQVDVSRMRGRRKRGRERDWNLVEESGGRRNVHVCIRIERIFLMREPSPTELAAQVLRLLVAWGKFKIGVKCAQAVGDSSAR
jgi:hypothetical protein